MNVPDHNVQPVLWYGLIGWSDRFVVALLPDRARTLTRGTHSFETPRMSGAPGNKKWLGVSIFIVRDDYRMNDPARKGGAAGSHQEEKNNEIHLFGILR